MEAISQEVLQIKICRKSLKIALLELLPNFQRPNELIAVPPFALLKWQTKPILPQLPWDSLQENRVFRVTDNSIALDDPGCISNNLLAR